MLTSAEPRMKRKGKKEAIELAIAEQLGWQSQ
jgi:hypothetical protein